jgi:hypothetical protein
MNITILFLLLIFLYSIVWHVNSIKKEKQLHSLFIHEIEEKMELEIIKQKNMQNKSKTNHWKVIGFKLSIVKQQVDLLSTISNQNEF